MTMTTTASSEATQTLTQFIGTWLTSLFEDKTNLVTKALTEEEQNELKELINGTLFKTVITQLSGSIDQQSLLGKLQKRQTDFATFMQQVPTVEEIVGQLLKTIETSTRPVAEKLKGWAIACTQWLYSIIETILRFIRNLDISMVLPDWMAKRVNGGNNANALAFFLALPSSKLKDLLDAAS